MQVTRPLTISKKQVSCKSFKVSLPYTCPLRHFLLYVTLCHILVLHTHVLYQPDLQLSSSEVTIMLSLVQGGKLMILDYQFMRSSIDIQWQIGQIHASQSAQDRLVADSSKTGISCTSSALNNLFASYKGIPYGCITEFCGEAGSGKTQLRYTLNEWEELIYLSPLFSMQLAVNALLPSELGGSEGECIYIGN